MNNRIISALGPVERLTRRDVISAAFDTECGDFVLVARSRNGRGRQCSLWNWTEALRDGDINLNALLGTGAGVDIRKIGFIRD